MFLNSINHGFIRELWAILTLYLSTLLTGEFLYTNLVPNNFKYVVVSLKVIEKLL